nr:MAG TPA: hypothetical protein [Caudoviricetes sp.]
MMARKDKGGSPCSRRFRLPATKGTVENGTDRDVKTSRMRLARSPGMACEAEGKSDVDERNTILSSDNSAPTLSKEEADIGPEDISNDHDADVLAEPEKKRTRRSKQKEMRTVPLDDTLAAGLDCEKDPSVSSPDPGDLSGRSSCLKCEFNLPASLEEGDDPALEEPSDVGMSADKGGNEEKQVPQISEADDQHCFYHRIVPAQDRNLFERASLAGLEDDLALARVRVARLIQAQKEHELNGKDRGKSTYQLQDDWYEEMIQKGLLLVNRIQVNLDKLKLEEERIDILREKLRLAKRNMGDEDAGPSDDGFIEALSEAAQEVWKDEEAAAGCEEDVV